MFTGKDLKRYRELRGLSQEELAAKCWVTRDAIAKIEQQNRTIRDVERLRRLVEVLNIPLEEAFGEPFSVRREETNNLPSDVPSDVSSQIQEASVEKYDYFTIGIQELLLARHQQGWTLEEMYGKVRLALERFDEMGEQQDKEGTPLSRRQALTILIGLPLTLLGVKPTQGVLPFIDEEILPIYATGISACWQLSNAKGLAEIEQVLPTYLTQLTTLAHHTSKHQKVAANLASQAHQLGYVIASHREDFSTALAHCKEAFAYGQMAEDANLQVAALSRQAVTFLHRKRPSQTLLSFQEALPHIKEVSPLLRTRIYAGLAEVYGKLGHKQNAIRSIGLAYDNFPDDPENDPAFPYTNFGYSSLFLHEGLAYFDLQQINEAQDAFAKVDGLQPKMLVSERTRIDFLNQQALTASALGDLEQFSVYLEAAITSAVALGSDLRYSEAWDVYQRTKVAWGNEHRIKGLAELFHK